MALNEAQRKKVEENIGLVYKVIKDKVHGLNQLGIYTFEDYLQIGCIGLCKAAATDKGGTFSTYAYRLIWNEICDALIYANRRQSREYACDELPIIVINDGERENLREFHMDIKAALHKAKELAPPSTRKGIEAIELMSRGYTSREIGEQMNASANLVCAWVSKARKFLGVRPEIAQIAEAYHISA